jgi:hypothetical protein
MVSYGTPKTGTLVLTAFISFRVFHIFLVLVGTRSLWSISSQYPFVLTCRREFSGNQSKEEEGPGLHAAGGEWCVASNCLVCTPLSLLTEQNSAVTKAKEEEFLPAAGDVW